LKAWLKKLYRFGVSTSGNVAVSFGIAAGALVAVGGGVVDYTKQTAAYSHLQGVADGAVLVGANELKLSGSTGYQQAKVQSVAAAYVKRNVKENIAMPDTAINVSPESGNLQVTLTGVVKTPFFGMLGLNSASKVTVRSSARIVGGLPLCVLAMEETKEKAIAATGSSKLTATGCTVQSNSVHVKSIEVWGRARLDTGLTCSAGGADGGGSNYNPAATTDCPAITDPLASKPAPSITNCDFNDTMIPNGSHTLVPGVYCGGIKITGRADVEFSPGRYVIKDGKFEMTGRSISQGNYVSFYFTGDGSALKITGQAEVEFSAIKTGVAAGLLMYENRHNVKPVVHEITSPNVESLVGTIYFPKSEFRVSINSSGNGDVAKESAFTVIIARMLTLNGRSNLVLNTDYAGTDVPLPSSIARLSGEIVIVK